MEPFKKFDIQEENMQECNLYENINNILNTNIQEENEKKFDILLDGLLNEKNINL